MILPTLHGKLKCNNFFIYAACDSVYFEEFGRAFINSVLQNTDAELHIHIFNPTDEQLNLCTTTGISFSYEFVAAEQFIIMADQWNREPVDPLEKLRRDRTLNAMSKGKDRNVLDRMQKTYYACARFARLKHLTKDNNNFLALDIDAVVRNNIPTLPNNYDCYMYKITGPKARVLAGGLYSTGTSNSSLFITDYANQLIKNIENNYLYWSLDQDILDVIVPKYNIGNLPGSLIDWEMRSESIVWTAKGTRKERLSFKNEQKKYNP